MNVETTKEKVLEAASKSETVKQTLKILFPECFQSEKPKNENLKKTSDSSDNQTLIEDGKIYYTIHAPSNKKIFDIIKAKHPKHSTEAWATFTGNIAGKVSAELWVIQNTKRFSLEDIYKACEGQVDNMNIIVSKLTAMEPPDLCINHFNEIEY